MFISTMAIKKCFVNLYLFYIFLSNFYVLYCHNYNMFCNILDLLLTPALFLSNEAYALEFFSLKY